MTTLIIIGCVILGLAAIPFLLPLVIIGTAMLSMVVLFIYSLIINFLVQLFGGNR